MPNDNNSVPTQFLTPRISVIVAADSNGNLYLTLSQANSSSSTMEVYLHHLAAKLDSEHPRWREDTIILMDNAPYHKSSQIMKVFKKLRMPVCFFGPNSYNTAVAELIFANLKTVDLNPERLPLGKK